MSSVRRPLIQRRASLREFRDRHGVQWTVWEVIPASVDRRRLRDRRVARRPTRVRRLRHEPELLRSRGRAAGWLAFESRHAKFRLNPIPPDWDTCPDDALAALLDQATPARSPRRLLE